MMVCCGAFYHRCRNRPSTLVGGKMTDKPAQTDDSKPDRKNTVHRCLERLRIVEETLKAAQGDGQLNDGLFHPDGTRTRNPRIDSPMLYFKIRSAILGEKEGYDWYGRTPGAISARRCFQNSKDVVISNQSGANSDLGLARSAS